MTSGNSEDAFLKEGWRIVVPAFLCTCGLLTVLGVVGETLLNGILAFIGRLKMVAKSPFDHNIP